MITLIAPAHLRDTAATLCEAIAGPAGGGMFITPLYTDTSEPSHYISSGWVASEFAEALLSADHDTLSAMATAAGLEYDAALLAACDIGTEGWRTAIARLGLSREPAHEDQA